MIKKIFSFFIITVLCFVCFSSPASAYQISGFNILSKHVLLINTDTDTVLYQKNANEKAYPASITKIMTALVVLDNCKDLDNEKITTSYNAIHSLDGTGSTMLNLKEGEVLSAKEMLYALLMCSSADCAVALAEHFGGSVGGFVDMMNAKAKELKMNDSSFANVHGLHNDDHYTTANDIAKMVKAALKYDLFCEIVKSSRHRMGATNLSRERTLVTTNFLLDVSTAYYYPYCTGIKTGFTDAAGRCLVSTANKKGSNYLCIVLNCPPKNENGQSQRKEFVDAKNLFEWAFNNFEYKTLCDCATPIGETKVNLCKDYDHMPVVLQKDFAAVVPKLADGSTVSYKLHLDKKSYDAPIKAGDKLGTVEISYANEVLDTVPVVAGQDAKRSALLAVVGIFKDIFTSKIFIAIIIILLLGIFAFVLASVVLTRRARKRRKKVKYKRY